MKRTTEQQTIIDYIKKNDGLIMINACAGSGKTTLLQEISNELKPKTALYLAYNKTVATEAQGKFLKTVRCCTTHSLAFKPTVVSMKLKLGNLNYRSILDKGVRYDDKLKVIDYVRAFCLSKYLTFKEYAKAYRITPKYIEIATNVLNNMQNGKVDCSHAFYLKVYQILLAKGHIKYEEFDFIALDEAGDVNPVTLEIFKLLPAKKKIMVGDSDQNIYGFNHTINCFKEMKNEGELFSMTQSFRTSKEIAQRIEKFGRKYLDPKMNFRGVHLTDNTISTKAFIARTNTSLVEKMINLNTLGVQYGLTRTAKKIFELPLCVISFKYQGFISAPGYTHLQEDIDEYFEDDSSNKKNNIRSHILSLYKDDTALCTAISLVNRYRPEAIIACYEEARKHEKSNQTYTLGTSHSTKGLEFDEVELADDLNIKVREIMDSVADRDPMYLTPPELTELNLLYVACSRSRKNLINAQCL